MRDCSFCFLSIFLVYFGVPGLLVLGSSKRTAFLGVHGSYLEGWSYACTAATQLSTMYFLVSSSLRAVHSCRLSFSFLCIFNYTPTRRSYLLFLNRVVPIPIALFAIPRTIIVHYSYNRLPLRVPARKRQQILLFSSPLPVRFVIEIRPFPTSASTERTSAHRPSVPRFFLRPIQ